MLVMVNPVITPMGTETIMGVETCLSLPGMAGKVKRLRRIMVEYGSGERTRRVFYDRDSIAIQHEIDHLDGVLFIDKLEV